MRAGWIEVLAFWHTGHLSRPDRLIAVRAARGHFLMVGACFAGFLLLRPRAKDWLRFLVGGSAATACFVAIIYATGTQYISLVRRTFASEKFEGGPHRRRWRQPGP